MPSPYDCPPEPSHQRPLLHDLQYHVENGVPVLDNGEHE